MVRLTVHNPPRPLGALNLSHEQAGWPCVSDPNGMAITWQVDVYRGFILRLCQAPVLAAAAILQDVFNRGQVATWNQPRMQPLSAQSSSAGAEARRTG